MIIKTLQQAKKFEAELSQEEVDVQILNLLVEDLETKAHRRYSWYTELIGSTTMSMEEYKLHILSLNVAGPNNPLKRCRLHRMVKKKSADIVFFSRNHILEARNKST